MIVKVLFDTAPFQSWTRCKAGQPPLQSVNIDHRHDHHHCLINIITILITGVLNIYQVHISLSGMFELGSSSLCPPSSTSSSQCLTRKDMPQRQRSTMQWVNSQLDHNPQFWSKSWDIVFAIHILCSEPLKSQNKKASCLVLPYNTIQRLGRIWLKNCRQEKSDAQRERERGEFCTGTIRDGDTGENYAWTKLDCTQSYDECQVSWCCL